MILGQDVFHVIRPFEYFETDENGTPIAVRNPLGWVLSGPMPSTSGLFPTIYDFRNCYTDWKRLQIGRLNSKLVGHGIIWCLQTG